MVTQRFVNSLISTAFVTTGIFALTNNWPFKAGIAGACFTLTLWLVLGYFYDLYILALRERLADYHRVFFNSKEIENG